MFGGVLKFFGFGGCFYLQPFSFKSLSKELFAFLSSSLADVVLFFSISDFSLFFSMLSSCFASSISFGSDLIFFSSAGSFGFSFSSFFGIVESSFADSAFRSWNV